MLWNPWASGMTGIEGGGQSIPFGGGMGPSSNVLQNFLSNFNPQPGNSAGQPNMVNRPMPYGAPHMSNMGGMNSSMSGGMGPSQGFLGSSGLGRFGGGIMNSGSMNRMSGGGFSGMNQGMMAGARPMGRRLQFMNPSQNQNG